MTYSPCPYPLWWPTHQVSTVSPLYSCTLKSNASAFEIPQRMEPDRLAAPVDYQGRVLAGGRPPGSFLGETKTYPGAASGELAFTLMAGGRRSGRVRNALAYPVPQARRRPGCARLAHNRACPSARSRRPRRERPEKPSTRNPPPKPPAPGPLFRQIRPLIRLAAARDHKLALPPYLTNLQIRAPRQSRVTPLIFHENPQFCKLNPGQPTKQNC